MKGRKPIPWAVQKLRGGTRKTHKPAPPEVPHPPATIPQAPEHLDPIAQEEWRRVAAIIEPLGMLTEADRAVLESYCLYYSQMLFASAQLRKVGAVYRRKDGSPGLNPYWRIMGEANQHMLKAALELGLSPVSRERMKVERPKPQGKVEMFMGRKNGRP